MSSSSSDDEGGPTFVTRLRLARDDSSGRNQQPGPGETLDHIWESTRRGLEADRNKFGADRLSHCDQIHRYGAFLESKYSPFPDNMDVVEDLLEKQARVAVRVAVELGDLDEYLGGYNFKRMVGSGPGRKAEAREKARAREPKNILDVQKKICGYSMDDAGERDSAELAHLLVKRSQLLVNKKSPKILPFETILRDLDLAAKLMGPEEQSEGTSSTWNDLWYLRAFCQLKLGRFEDAGESLKAAEAAIKRDDGGNPNKAATREKKVKAGLDAVKRRVGKVERVLPVPPELKGRNRQFPDLSDAVEVRVTPDRGRGVFATRKILPGEVVCLEDAIVCAPCVNDSDIAMTHCHNCSAFSYCLLPCRGCPDVMFCSESCSDRAWDTFHEVECKTGLLGQTAKHQDVELVKRAGTMMRAVLMQPLSYYKENEKELRLLEETDHSLDPDRVYRASDPDSLWRLEIAKNKIIYLDRKPDTKFMNALLAAFPFRLLQLAGYVEEGSEELVAKLLLHAYRAKFINSLDMREVKRSERFVPKDKELTSSVDVSCYRMDTAAESVFLAASMFNHSCLRNAGAVTVGGSRVAVVASDVIQPGDEVVVMYGADAGACIRHEVHVRWEIIASMLGFQCSCPACLAGLGGYDWNDKVNPAAILDWAKYNKSLMTTYESVVNGERNITYFLSEYARVLSKFHDKRRLVRVGGRAFKSASLFSQVVHDEMVFGPFKVLSCVAVER